jgi:hypothetical protein
MDCHSESAVMVGWPILQCFDFGSGIGIGVFRTPGQSIFLIAYRSDNFWVKSTNNSLLSGSNFFLYLSKKNSNFKKKEKIVTIKKVTIFLPSSSFVAVFGSGMDKNQGPGSATLLSVYTIHRRRS